MASLHLRGPCAARCHGAMSSSSPSGVTVTQQRQGQARAWRLAAAAQQQQNMAAPEQRQGPLLAAAAVAASALLSFCSPASCYAAYAGQTDRSQQAAFMQQEEEEEQEEEEAALGDYQQEPSQELLSFVAKYDTLGGEQLAAAREALGFRRAPDGRVLLRARGGELFGVKPDMQAPGFLLLRDEAGYCFYIPPDPEGQLAQIDLSDDLVVAQLFASGVWQELLEPLDAQAQDGSVQQLVMSEGEFRQVVSLLEGALEAPEEELPE